MNNFLRLCFLCPLSCYFFPPGSFPFPMQIFSPPSPTFVSLLPRWSLVIITKTLERFFFPKICFAIYHKNILVLVTEYYKNKNTETFASVFGRSRRVKETFDPQSSFLEERCKSLQFLCKSEIVQTCQQLPVRLELCRPDVTADA